MAGSAPIREDPAGHGALGITRVGGTGCVDGVQGGRIMAKTRADRSGARGGLIRRRPGPPAPVAKSWRRIEAWLDAHWTGFRNGLRPGADEAEIEAIGRSLPDDVRESYRLHDGQRQARDDLEHNLPGLFFGAGLNPLRDRAEAIWGD